MNSWRESLTWPRPPTDAYEGMRPTVPASGSSMSMGSYTSGSVMFVRSAPESLSWRDAGAMEAALWEKLKTRPVIIQCAHCASHNAITNPSCIRCGAPMGNSYRVHDGLVLEAREVFEPPAGLGSPRFAY